MSGACLKRLKRLLIVPTKASLCVFCICLSKYFGGSMAWRSSGNSNANLIDNLRGMYNALSNNRGNPWRSHGKSGLP